MKLIRIVHIRLCEKVAEDGAVEAGNTRGSGDESLKIRREETELIDGAVVVVGELVKGEEGSDNDLRFRELRGLGRLVDEVLEASSVG